MFEVATLTPEQERKWSETMTLLYWQCPGFTHIFLSMMAPDWGGKQAVFTKQVPIAATDGRVILLNPDTFFQYNLKERVFICVHEIAHNMLNHIGVGYQFKKRGKVTVGMSSLPYSPEVMNVATDLVINDLLVSADVGQYNKDWLHDRAIATKDDSAIDVYAKLTKDNKASGKGKAGGGKGVTQPGKSFDEHLDPGAGEGKNPDEESTKRNEGAWSQAVAAAANIERQRGNGKGTLARFFEKMLEPTVDWRDKIRGIFSRRVGNDGYTWRRPDRRLIVRDIYAPGRSGHGAGLVAVAVDTSGSISGPEITAFLSEIAGILEDVRPARTLVLWCDAGIQGVDEVSDPSDLPGLKPKGGGGTDFNPVFDYIYNEGLEPDALVYLTDGCGSFPPHAPVYHTIWGSVSPNVKYPFGDVVDIPRAA